jgi:ABC-2 type transport system ATP-binding protein
VATLLTAARRIEESHIEVDDISLRRPSLDDVFLALTSPGGTAQPGTSTSPPGPRLASEQVVA